MEASDNSSSPAIPTASNHEAFLRPDIHHWHFYLSPKATWGAMYRDCVDAKRSIAFEQYIFENDEVGQKFLRVRPESL
jgi:hypothetical protein